MGNKQVNLYVEKDQKERWDEEVEESNQYESLSQLIRLAVEKELKGAGKQEQSIEIDVSSLEDSLRNLNNRISGIEKQLDEVKQTVASEQNINISRLAAKIYTVIPVADSQDDAESFLFDDSVDIRPKHFQDPKPNRAEKYGCVNDIAAAIGVTHRNASQAVDILTTDVEEVQSFYISDYRFVWRFEGEYEKEYKKEDE